MVRTTRKKYVTFFFIFICVVPMFAGSDEELFLRANKLYAQKEYGNAFDTYEMMSKKGRAVLYNMGNCLFRTEDYPRALVFWSRAQVGATPHEYNLIMHNKEIALKKLGKQTEQPWWQQIIEWLRVRSLYVSLLFLQLFFLMCLWFSLVMMRKKQTGLKKIAQCKFFACMVILLFPLSEYYKTHNNPCAIVVKREAKLFAGPDKSFHVVAPLAYADYTKIKQVREGWYKIRYAGMIGWVEADVIQII